MEWQLAIVAMLVGAAALYLAGSTWRTWRGTKGKCGGGCGCSRASSAASITEQPKFIPIETIKLKNARTPF